MKELEIKMKIIKDAINLLQKEDFSDEAEETIEFLKDKYSRMQKKKNRL